MSRIQKIHCQVEKKKTLKLEFLYRGLISKTCENVRIQETLKSKLVILIKKKGVVAMYILIYK